MGHSPGDEPLTLTIWYSCGLSKLYEAFGWKSVCGQAYNIKGIKRKISVFLLFLQLFLCYCSSFHGMIRADPRWLEEMNVNI